MVRTTSPLVLFVMVTRAWVLMGIGMWSYVGIGFVVLLILSDFVR